MINKFKVAIIFFCIITFLPLTSIFLSCGILPTFSNKEVGDIKLIKESLFAQHKDTNISLDFEIENYTDTKKSVEIIFKLRSIYDDNYDYGTKKVNLEVEKGKHLFSATIPTPQLNSSYYYSKSDYVWFNINYSVADDKTKYFGVKSLYSAMIKYNMQVVASNQWEAESSVPVRVKVLKASSEDGLANEEVKVTLTKNDEKATVISTASYKTDKDGEVLVDMKSPKDTGSYTLKIETKSEKSDISEASSFPINVNKDIKIYITTDKPMYQPGQNINIRTLALGVGKKPVGNEDIVITVLDGKGNKVFKEETKTNEFGVSSAIFQLASFVNLGIYKIEVALKDTVVEKSVSVEKYVLPKFKVSLKTDKEFYGLGEKIVGTVSGNYFFGKPVSNSEVLINMYTFDVEWNLISTLTGYTNENGDYSFNMEVPKYLVGSQLEQGAAFVRLEIILTDNAKHTQGIDKTVAVSNSPIVAVVFPETERFSQDMEIKFFVVTADPLGRAMSSDNTIKIGDKSYNVKTNDFGVGSFLHKIETLPVKMKINSKTSQYYSETSLEFSGSADFRSEHILLRNNKPTYRVGESIELDILSTFDTKKVYFDIVKENKTVLTKTVPLKNKKANLSIPVSSDMDGILRLSAYTILSDSYIVRDTRLVYVDVANELQVSVLPQKSEYLPGEKATLDISVLDGNGKGKQSAVGFVIVDEAVYALQENKPGLERVYFEVEEAFKNPKYEIHSFSYENIFVGTDKIDSEKAEIFLTANNNDIDFGIQYSSAFKDFDTVKANLQYYVDEKCNFPVLEKLYNFIYKNDGNLRDPKTPLSTQIKDIVDNNRIIVYDLWKTEMKLGIDGETVKITSAGLDQSFGTKDDFTLEFQAETLTDTYWEYNYRNRIKMVEEGDFNNRAFAVENETTGAGINESTVTPSATENEKGSGEQGGDDGVRVRKYFPETLHVEPSLITDTKGKGSVSLTVADSITTWRISSTANSKDGELGSSVSSLKVFQEFFIDIDFPVSLTQNDQVSVPIAIYNYLQTNQTIELKVRKDDWFDLLDEATKKRTLKPNEITVEYFTIKVKDIGNYAFQITAKGSTKSDAIERRIEIKPDGDPIEISYSDRLDETVTKILTLPPDMINKSQQVIVKIYPGLFSQVVEGLDSLFRLPSGCFEQTSSTTYPNILTLRYMQDAKIISPEIEMKASTYINQGYQRLLTFEVNGGGFSWFGDAPAHNILTAYGLMEFYDMSFVHNVDPAVIMRTQNYLVSKQSADGSFPPDDGGIAEGAINAYMGNILRNTGYLAWALAYSDYQGEAVQRALSYIRKNADMKADTYTLAILANALLTVNPKDETGQKILKELDSRKKEFEKAYYWEQKLATSMYGSDKVAIIETTALVAYAMMSGKSYFKTVEGAINYLIKQKDSFGNWESTQSTIATLRTFIKSMESGSSPSEGTIGITIGEKKVKEVKITKSNYDVMQQIDISPFVNKGDNKVILNMKANEGASFLYQIAGSFYIPRQPAPAGAFQPVSISVAYDKTTLSVDDMVTVNVSVANNYKDINLGMMIVDIGIAPGFDVVMDDFEKYLENEMFTRVEPKGRQLTLYIKEMKAKSKIDFSYRMKARFPMKVASPSATFYSYYGTEEASTTPAGLQVNG